VFRLWNEEGALQCWENANPGNCLVDGHIGILHHNIRIKKSVTGDIDFRILPGLIEAGLFHK